MSGAKKGGSSPDRKLGGKRLEHWVSNEPFDPHVAEALTAEQERIFMASQWRMMWARFKRHKLAVWSGALLALIYFSVLISEFIAPYNMNTRHTDHIFAPPQSVNIFHEGEIRAPFTYGLKYTLNMENLKREYGENRSKVNSIRFLCLGDKYKFWGMIEMRFHLVCPPKGGTLFLLGTDRLGRDMFSRIVMGTRISLTVGLIGIAISFMLGMFFGGLAGYYGGWVDNITQRVIEVIRSFPELPLWMALSAALPVTWSPILIYFGINYPRPTGLDWTSARCPIKTSRSSRRRFRVCRPADGCKATPYNLASYDAKLHEPSNSISNTLNPRYDLGRNCTFISRTWLAPANYQLGCSVSRSPEYKRCCLVSMANAPRRACYNCDTCVQLLRRRVKRRRRSL